MEKRKLGKLEVSKIGMGTMAFSHGYGKIPERQYSTQAIRQPLTMEQTGYRKTADK